MRKIILIVSFMLNIVFGNDIVANEQNTIIDVKTNLMWQDDKIIQRNMLDFNSSIEYCENLRIDEYDNWRLPNKEELEDLYSRKNILKNMRTGRFWSNLTDEVVVKPNNSFFGFLSSKEKSRPALNGWVVLFCTGQKGWNALEIPSFVRCVRDNSVITK